MLGHGVAEAAARLAERLGARRVGIFGEVYGAGVQDLAYGADGRSRDARVTPCSTSPRRSTARSAGWTRLELLEGELPLVPRLYEGPYDIERVLELATGRETVSGRELHLREGVVIRPATERYSPVTGGRADREGGQPGVSDPQGRHGVRVDRHRQGR